MDDQELEKAAIEARRAYQREWREKNAEHLKQYNKSWSEKNRDKVRAANMRYWKKKALEKYKEQEAANQ